MAKPARKIEQEIHFVENSSLKANAVILAALVVFFVGYVIMYVRSQYLNWPVDEALLYFAEDPGYVAGSYSDEPLLGVHRFGDYLTLDSWIEFGTPYSKELDLPSNYGPIANLVGWILNFFSKTTGVAILSIATLLLQLVAFGKLTASLDRIQQAIFLITAVFLTRPFLLTLDRGNLQGLVVGLEALAVWALYKRRDGLASGAIAFAAGMKFYPLLLALIFIGRGQFRQAAYTVFGSLAAIGVGFALFSKGDLLGALEGLYKAIGVTSVQYLSGSSASAWVLRFFALFDSNPSNELQPLLVKVVTLILTCALVGLLLLGMKVGSYHGSRLIVLILCVTSLIVPISWAYNLGVSSLGIVILVMTKDWVTGKKLLDIWALLGFIPTIALIPWIASIENVKSSGIAEFWMFPFVLSLLIIWGIRVPKKR